MKFIKCFLAFSLGSALVNLGAWCDIPALYIAGGMFVIYAAKICSDKLNTQQGSGQ